MQIERVINNNVVSAIDHKGKEVVVMGKGIGFQMKQGKVINETLIEKIFYLENQSAVDKFKELIEDLPLEHIQVSNDIITYANKVLGGKLNPNIYITLTDHISFALQRFKQGMLFENPLAWDVQSLYRKEFLIGEYAVALIHKKIGIRLPDDESASIALHLVNAEYDSSMNETMHITKMLPEIIQIVKNEFNLSLEEQSINHERLVTHLKFMIQRIIKKEQLDNIDQEFCDMVKNMYSKEFRCSTKIAEYLQGSYHDVILMDELVMLTINIRRVTVGNSSKN